LAHIGGIGHRGPALRTVSGATSTRSTPPGEGYPLTRFKLQLADNWVMIISIEFRYFWGARDPHL
jgi:hypothetical protein